MTPEHHADAILRAAGDAIELKPCPVCGQLPRWRGSSTDYRAEKIAAALKAAEKQVLLQHSPYLQSWGGKNDTKLPPWSIGRELRILGLIDFAGDLSSQTRLTPLGKQVRIIFTHLKDRTHD